MVEDQELVGTSFESFEDAAGQALGPQRDNEESFVVVRLGLSRGGVVGRTQYYATVQRSDGS
jgi:flavin-binding protein dodecin